MHVLALVAILSLVPRLDTAEPQPAALLYLITEPTAVRAEADARSRSIAKLHRYDVVSGRELAKGWLYVEGTTAPHGAGGWVPLLPENVVRGPLDALKLRVFRVQQTKWSDSVKLDVLRGRVRDGFTGNQVQLALGDPLRKELQQAGRDVVEAWTYADVRIVFSHRGVDRIEPAAAPLPQNEADR